MGRESAWGHLPSFKILYSSDPLLGIAHHFTEEVGEACSAELCGAGPVEVSIINGFAVRGGAELLRSSLGGGRLLGGGGVIGLGERLKALS